MKKRILTVSSASLSLCLDIETLPFSGGERRGKSFHFVPGGKGVVASTVLSILGMDSIFCSKIGTDAYGKQLMKFFDAVGTDTRFLTETRNEKTTLQVVITEETGTRRTLSFPGAVLRLTHDDIENAFTAYPDAVYLQHEVGDLLVSDTVALANENGTPVFYQPCRPRNAAMPELSGRLEAVIFDEDEVLSYCGIEPTEMEKYLSAAMALYGRFNTKYVIFRTADRGTYVYDGKYYDIICGVPGAPVIDTAGAEEAFGAALTARYVETGDIKKAIAFANLIYTICAEKKGEVDSVPTRDEIRAYMEKNEIVLD